MKQLFGSSGSENMRRNSRSPTSFSSLATSSAMPERVASSFSARAISKRPRESRNDEAIAASPVTVASRDFFSLPRSWRALGVVPDLGIVRERFDFRSGVSVCPRSQRYLRSSADRLSRSESVEAI